MFENRLQPHIPERKRKPSHREQLLQSIKMKNTPLEAGTFAALSPLPCFFSGIFLMWIIAGIAFLFAGFLYEEIPGAVSKAILSTTAVIPFIMSPALGVLGIVHSIIQRKTKRAGLGCLLSVLCILENATLFAFVGYIGSRY